MTDLATIRAHAAEHGHQRAINMLADAVAAPMLP